MNTQEQQQDFMLAQQCREAENQNKMSIQAYKKKKIT